MPVKRSAPRLTLAEAYQAAETFLVHIGATPSRLEEPLDGIVEFEGSGYFSRLRYDDAPVAQAAVLALLKQIEGRDQTPILFSASGFSDSAEVFADNVNVALFSMTEIGDVEARGRAAQHLLPSKRFEPPFAPSADEDADRPPDTSMQGQSAIADHEWLDCPTCGTTHHPDANFCHRCGAGLSRKNRVDPTTRRRKLDMADAPDPVEVRNRAAAQAGTAESHGRTGTLRCVNCGSLDIEMLRD